MSSSIPLPLRLAPPPQQQQPPPPSSQPEPPSQPQPQPLRPPGPEPAALETQVGVAELPPPVGEEQPPSPLPPAPPPPRSVITAATEGARPHDAISHVAQWVEATQPKEDHQFWLNDPKIVEGLFTIHRSARHLLDFTSTLVGSHEGVLGQRPVPIMSDGDVLFMTQLASDISRSVGGISAVRHHGARAAARKRKARPEPSSHYHPHSQHHHQHQPRDQDDHDHDHDHPAASVKRVHHSPSHTRPAGAVSSRTAALPRPDPAGAAADLVCYKCGRTDTPEWRRGPDGGVLCNVCGLLYAKQRRKIKSARGGTHSHSHSHRSVTTADRPGPPRGGT